ncbi:hypothetical protein DD237_002819 [Peronospora effusa]|uniref:Defective in cullin neddylation protein n=1 Tax=Peronospora effusa TaxID=542832 RepID=A0A3R7WMH8_9STRA|nr:hypothetical protein DD237_002819 [Peronospora effusa]
MLHDLEEATTWLCREKAMKSGDDWLLDHPLELVEKEDDGKMAHDVDDLSAIFKGLVDGVDLPLPCDDLEEDIASGDASVAWIDSLNEDVVNMSDLSAAFDTLVQEQQNMAEVLEECEDEEMEEDDSDDERMRDVKIIPSAPVGVTMAPLDPRSCIRTPVFQNLDSRIPRIQIPRIDLSFSVNSVALKDAGVPDVGRSEQSMSPKSEKAKVAKYHHDPKTCWICKSSKTLEKKRALHRFHEKRTRRNWKRGPRYTGRSNVATSRVRNGGRFICTSHKSLNDKKKKLQAFKNTTNTNDSMAKSYLEKFSWDLMRAVDGFYANESESLTLAKKSTISMERVNAWFDSYIDPDDDEDSINEEGILKFCDDIGVDPQDIVVLVIAWKMQAAYMCAFTRREWQKGMQEMDCDSVAKLKTKLPQLRQVITSTTEFKKFYSFCFGFSKEPGQKSLSIDIAVAMWELLLSTRFEKLMKSWLAFLAEKKPVKGVTRDTWDLLFDFFVKVRDSYGTYNENEAWPVLIDDYMVWIDSKK